MHIRDLRLGEGSPSYTDCLIVAADRLRLHVFLDDETRIVTAMIRRNLHIMGLPGARLPRGTVLPGLKDICVLARGGPSYASRLLFGAALN